MVSHKNDSYKRLSANTAADMSLASAAVVDSVEAAALLRTNH
jgi:hypothetical protein